MSTLVQNKQLLAFRGTFHGIPDYVLAVQNTFCIIYYIHYTTTLDINKWHKLRTPSGSRQIVESSASQSMYCPLVIFNNSMAFFKFLLKM